MAGEELVPNDSSMPVEQIRQSLLQAVKRQPVIVTAPTGTGKSTRVPLWFDGSVLMVQPRRVACRSVAARLAQQLGQPLGRWVGYRVRDEESLGSETRILLVTPGIVLANPEILQRFDTVILDEVHERRIDTDTILALLVSSARPFVAMSATIEGAKLATYARGRHFEIETRMHPVHISYEHAGDRAPSREGLGSRVVQALRELSPRGISLVFVPGKAEIGEVVQTLRGERIDARPLHGGLTLKQQSRALEPTVTTEMPPGRHATQGSASPPVIVTTNVAETSITVAGVTTVIDAGLVRRTAYHQGHSTLTLKAIAWDSAEQRAGRAGRTGPGVCRRLWGRLTKLEARTPPEIERESLAPMLLTLGKLEKKPEQLSFVDAPKDYALRDAREQLRALGAMDEFDQLTALGRELERLPLDPWLSRTLVEARERDCLRDAIDFAACLESGFDSRLLSCVDELNLERLDCDLTAMIQAIRSAAPEANGHATLMEARRRQHRLLRSFGLKKTDPAHFDASARIRLLSAVAHANPGCLCLPRHRKGRMRFSGGGTEMELARSSRVNQRLERGSATEGEPRLEALVALDVRASASGARSHHLTITAAAPVSLDFAAGLGLGEERLGRVSLEKGRVSVVAERHWAGQVIASRRVEPTGALARQAISELFLRGSLHRPALLEARRRLSRSALAARLGAGSEAMFAACKAPPPIEQWLLTRLETLGVESAADLELLAESDFLPDDVPAELAPALDERFPLQVDLGDCVYRAEYDLSRKRVLLSIERGQRSAPPPAGYLPRFDGLKVFAEAAGSFHRIR